MTEDFTNWAADHVKRTVEWEATGLHPNLRSHWEPLRDRVIDVRDKLKAEIESLPHPQNDIDQDIAYDAFVAIRDLRQWLAANDGPPEAQELHDELSALMLHDD